MLQLLALGNLSASIIYIKLSQKTVVAFQLLILANRFTFRTFFIQRIFVNILTTVLFSFIKWKHEWLNVWKKKKVGKYIFPSSLHVKAIFNLWTPKIGASQMNILNRPSSYIDIPEFMRLPNSITKLARLFWDCYTFWWLKFSFFHFHNFFFSIGPTTCTIRLFQAFINTHLSW